MRIARAPASFPVLRVRSLVTHMTPRRPTAIERMLLRLCTELGEHPTYGEQPVDRLFEDWLGMPDAALLVAPCIDDLVTLLVLERRDRSTGEMPRLRDLVVTERGAEMIRLGQLPGKATDEEVVHHVDPISRTVVREKARGTLAAVPHIAHRGASDVADVSEVIRAALPVGGHAWLTKDTVVDEVRSRVEAVHWKERMLEVHADVRTGALSATVGDDVVDRWLAGLEPGDVWFDFLGPVLGLDRGEDDDRADALPLVSLDQAVGVAPLDDLSAMLDGAGRAVVAMTRERSEILGDAPERALHVVLEAGGTETVLQWSRSGSGARLRLPDVEDGRGLVTWWMPRPGADPVTWSSGRTSFSWSGESRQVAIAVRGGAAEAHGRGVELLERVRAALHAMPDPLAVALCACWDAPEVVLEQAIAVDTGGVASKLARATALRQRIELVRGAKVSPQAWEARLRAIVETGVREVRPGAAVGELVELGRAAQAAGLKDISDLVAPLIERVAPPSDLATLRAARAFIGATAPLAPSWFSPSIARALIDDAFAPRPDELGGSPVEQAARGARSALDAVGVQVRGDPAALKDDPACEAVLPHLRAGVVAALARWRRAATALRAALPEGTVLDGSRFDVVDTGLGVLEAFLRRHVELEAPQGRPVVIDTNALIDFPDLLRWLEKGEVPVLPKRVLDELDEAKLDAEVAGRVREAQRSLHAAGERVHYVGSDLSQLSDDFRASGDNRVLSVAVRLRLFDPLLLTADRNLQLKARAEHVRFDDPREFVKRRRPPTPKSKGPGRSGYPRP